nr:unnamed protein product [Callosobruchus analis]
MGLLLHRNIGIRNILRLRSSDHGPNKGRRSNSASVCDGDHWSFERRTWFVHRRSIRCCLEVGTTVHSNFTCAASKHSI